MSRYERPFKIQLPVIRMPVSHGGLPAIVLLSVVPAGEKDPQVVFCTCIDIEGRGLQQVPIHINTLRAAAIQPMTFVETDDVIAAPTSNIIVPRKS